MTQVPARPASAWAEVVVIALALAGLPFSFSGAGASPGWGPRPELGLPFDEGPQDRQAMDRLLRDQSRSRGAAAESVGYRAAVYARQHLLALRHRDQPLSATAEREEREFYEKALAKAADPLPPGTLAAVGVYGPHPILSRAYVKALERRKDAIGGPGGIDPAEEASAEARDALRRFGYERTRDIVKSARGLDTSSVGAGGIDRSVYSIDFILPRHEGETWPGATFVEGFERGLESAAGPLRERFDVTRSEPDPSDHALGLALHGTGISGANGVIVVTDESSAFSAATGVGATDGIVAIDARAPADADPLSAVEDGIPHDVIPGLESPEHLETLPPLRTFLPDLSYRPVRRTDQDRLRWRHLRVPVIRMRPPGIERGRRLAEVIRSRPAIKRVAIAIPSSGGDRTLAVGFGAALQTLGRELVVLEYESGRRDYGPEAKRFVESGANAILFAGPGEETGEWLLALARQKARPLLLGSEELGPGGFHESQRRLLEGAVIAGSDWEDRSGPIFEQLRKLGPGEHRPDFRRGFRLGWIYGRAVLEGNFTATSLALAFARRSISLDSIGTILVPIASTAPAGGVPTEVVVPLSIVKNGEAVPLTGF